MSYSDFLASKVRHASPCGFDPPPLMSALFPWQRAIVRWALRRGRACIFADTGLGKTRMQLEWARRVVDHAGGSVLILAPLAVASQTKEEGAKVGIRVTRCREQSDVRDGVNVTNYDRLHLFAADAFSGVVLDESSILKSHDGKTRQAILDAFRTVPYRLACTATPAPNDHMELGQHAEFVGAMSAAEMLATFFVHDGGETQKWRLKGHARRDFWRWVASWACLVRKPSDLGFPDDGYALPPLRIHERIVDSDAAPEGMLFAFEAETLQERIGARRASVADRVAEAAAIVNATDEACLVWCHLNEESRQLAAAIPDAIEVTGSDSAEDKEAAMAAFSEGRARVLVSKPSICGYGMNWQHCRNVVFVGVSDSWESYYQAVRRCWRFGQTREVNVYVIYARTEGAVIANLQRKEADAATMAEEMAREAATFVRAEVSGITRNVADYDPRLPMELPKWLMLSA